MIENALLCQHCTKASQYYQAILCDWPTGWIRPFKSWTLPHKFTLFIFTSEPWGNVSNACQTRLSDYTPAFRHHHRWDCKAAVSNNKPKKQREGACSIYTLRLRPECVLKLKTSLWPRSCFWTRGLSCQQSFIRVFLFKKITRGRYRATEKTWISSLPAVLSFSLDITSPKGY